MEKFKVILNNEKVLGLKGCPVQVEKYNILFNNSTERNVIQLKLRNRAEKTIKSVYLEIDCFDDTKDNLGTLKDIVYLNVNAAQGKTFGDRQAVNTNFSIISSINIKIIKAAFDDETIWRNEDEAYLGELPQPTEGSAYFGILYDQYKRETVKIKAHSEYAYGEKEDYWQCSCGQNNDYENKSCFACRTDRNKLTAISDLQYLGEENQKYLIAEEQERQRLEAQRLAEEAERQRIEEQQKKEAEEKAKQQQEEREKLKKWVIKISVPIAIVICALIIITSFRKKVASDVVLDGCYHTVGLKNDGTVVAAGDNDEGECNVENWKNITAVSAGFYHTIGLKNDGTVVAVGDNDEGQCDVENWKNITAVSAGLRHTIGLKQDGTVIMTGSTYNDNFNVEDWRNITAISTMSNYIIGLKQDGTVVATGNNYYDQCNVNYWTDIIAVSAGLLHTVGLKQDGTVVAIGLNEDDQCDVESWTDIVAVSAGGFHTVGLKQDGTVVAIGNNECAQCDVESWTDIVAVSAGAVHTVGLKQDGTVVVTGNNDYGQCDVEDWKDIMIY